MLQIFQGYIIVGIILTTFLFISSEIESNYFTQKLNLKTKYKVITNPVVLCAYLIMILLWPLALIRLIYSYLGDN